MGGRPLSVVRGPRGHTGTTFFQKHVADGLPTSIRGVVIRDDEGETKHLVIDDVAGLAALAQIDILEIHVWGARADDVEHPDRVVFDLDPDEGLPWEIVVSAAHAVRVRLEHVGLRSFVKTTGGKGLHVVVPFVRRHGWPAIKAFSQAVAADMARRLPQHFTANQVKAARAGKIYLDWLRNTRGATAIAPYSTRARPGAPVATPLFWEELGPKIGPAHFTVRSLPERLAALPSDPWADMGRVRQSITAAVRRDLGLKA